MKIQIINIIFKYQLINIYFEIKSNNKESKNKKLINSSYII